MAEDDALISCQAPLAELSKAFSKRAVTPDRDYAGRSVDAALFANLERLACQRSNCSDRCARKHLHTWLRTPSSAIPILNLQLEALEHSFKSLNVEGRGSRFTSGRKREVEKLRASAMETRNVLLKEGTRRFQAARRLRTNTERIPVEVLEHIFHFVFSVGHTGLQATSPVLHSREVQRFNQSCLASFSLVSHRWFLATQAFGRGAAVIGSLSMARSLLLNELLFPSANRLRFLTRLDLLDARLSEPNDTIYLR
ncbi:hypothetical protein HDU67_009542, partial [Dinochytrium kinnereticum]